ncbi:MAG: hypothetical protein WAV41_03855 [Microgenomates group bacterium]
MVSTKVFIENLGKGSILQRATEKACVPKALGTAVGVQPDTDSIVERYGDMLKGAANLMSTRKTLLERGMAVSEIKSLEGEFPELDTEIGKIHQYIGRMRKTDTDFGMGLRDHKFIFEDCTIAEIDKTIDAGGRYLALCTVEDEAGQTNLHLTCVGKKNGELTLLSDVTPDGSNPPFDLSAVDGSIMGWRVTPNTSGLKRRGDKGKGK